ncbi:hypothetical protein MSP7336_01843 [Mycobacterium shimoidei]|uniref:Uncharacterized protein n=1 Tax=Mycobacterium shimoidei TaxID=29313 RepID=A0A375YXI4_MYCSH|nr:hypothetical protein MSP7336_01843 [Mycobacterium shimoidei]
MILDTITAAGALLAGFLCLAGFVWLRRSP